jgi:hypothetical protein
MARWCSCAVADVAAVALAWRGQPRRCNRGNFSENTVNRGDNTCNRNVNVSGGGYYGGGYGGYAAGVAAGATVGTAAIAAATPYYYPPPAYPYAYCPYPNCGL